MKSAQNARLPDRVKFGVYTALWGGESKVEAFGGIISQCEC